MMDPQKVYVIIMFILFVFLKFQAATNIESAVKIEAQSIQDDWMNR